MALLWTFFQTGPPPFITMPKCPSFNHFLAHREGYSAIFCNRGNAAFIYMLLPRLLAIPRVKPAA